MPSIPIFAYPKNITTMTVAPCTVGSNGALTVGTAVSVKALLKEFDETMEPSHDEINPITSGRLNNVIIADGWRCHMDILTLNDTADPDKFMTLVLAVDIIKLIYVLGTAAGSIGTKTLYGVRGTKSLKTSGRSALISGLDLLCVDVGATDFVSYAVS